MISGYRTHGFGKWHLGFCSESYTPLRRGFHSYYGQFVGDEEERTRRPRDTRPGQTKPDHQKLGSRSKQKINRKRRKNKRRRQQNKKKKLPKEEKISQKHFRKPKKFGSSLYGSKAIDIIETKRKTSSFSKKQDAPFFIYLALFTKSYPREVAGRGPGGMERALQQNRRRKLSEMDNTVGEIGSHTQHKTSSSSRVAATLQFLTVCAVSVLSMADSECIATNWTAGQHCDPLPI